MTKLVLSQDGHNLIRKVYHYNSGLIIALEFISQVIEKEWIISYAWCLNAAFQNVRGRLTLDLETVQDIRHRLSRDFATRNVGYQGFKIFINQIMPLMRRYNIDLSELFLQILMVDLITTSYPEIDVLHNTAILDVLKMLHKCRICHTSTSAKFLEKLNFKCSSFRRSKSMITDLS